MRVIFLIRRVFAAAGNTAEHDYFMGGVVKNLCRVGFVGPEIPEPAMGVVPRAFGIKTVVFQAKFAVQFQPVHQFGLGIADAAQHVGLGQDVG